MWRCLCALVAVAGCWSDDPPINGLTSEQWSHFTFEFTLDGAGADACRGMKPNCSELEHLGQELFWDPLMSSPDGTHPGTLACVTCHDPLKYFVDTRDPNNVSQGATGPTGHNAMTVVNMALLEDLKPEAGVGFSWLGTFPTAGDVTQLAVTKAMGTTPGFVLGAVMANPYYADEARSAWPNQDITFADLELALDAYMRELVSLDAPFDHWILGDETAISDSAKRGFVIFVGRGDCASCHKGPAFTDYWVHDTGLAQAGTDHGLGSDDPRFEGNFATQNLRNIARTGPYMHDGSKRTLDDVVAFYRRGGDAGGYTGTKDPRITPLDLTDDDAADLVEFLKTLNGAAVPTALTKDIRPMVTCMPGTVMCDGICCGFNQICEQNMCVLSCGAQLADCNNTCVNELVDPMNCGSCGHVCDAVQSCEMGTCIDSTCPLPLSPCGQSCFDLETDPMNCGACGHVCATYCMNGVCG